MLSKLLLGQKGSDFDKVAFPAIRKALCMKGQGNCGCYSCQQQLTAHPDVMVLDQNSYLVEDIEKLISFARSSPMIAPVRAAYVKNFSGITEHSQNKLLKELEDNNNFYLVATTCGEDHAVLPTILSRVTKERVKRESREDFIKHFSHLAEDDVLFLYSMSGGYILLAEEMGTQVSIYRQVKEAILQQNKKHLFSALNLVADKDKGNYLELYSEYLDQLFAFMAEVVVDAYAERGVALLKIINKEKGKSSSKWYKVNDFFTSITKIAEGFSLIEKGESL